MPGGAERKNPRKNGSGNAGILILPRIRISSAAVRIPFYFALSVISGRITSSMETPPC